MGLVGRIFDDATLTAGTSDSATQLIKWGLTINSETKQALEGAGAKVGNWEKTAKKMWDGEVPESFFAFPLYGTSLKLQNQVDLSVNASSAPQADPIVVIGHYALDVKNVGG